MKPTFLSIDFLQSYIIRLPVALLACSYRSVILIILFLQCAGVINAQDRKVETRGVYGHPQKLWDKGHRLDQLGVNAVFLHHKSITQDFVDRAREEGQKIYAEFATLNGGGYVENHPEAWAIDNNGNKVEKATWFMGVCPTDSNFLQYRLDELATLVNQYPIDGVWLDYLHWHAQFEDPEPILPETCFNNSCTNRFEKETGIKVPEGTIKDRAGFILKNHEAAWRKWRSTVVADWVKKCSIVLKQANPRALLGIYHCPWNDSEYDSARYKNLGIDYEIIIPYADVFSPMVYHERMGRTPEWIKENIEWFGTKINNASTRIWPIVQAYNDPGIVSAAEFRTALLNALTGKATGIMMFTSSAVAEDEGKILVLKNVYRTLEHK